MGVDYKSLTLNDVDWSNVRLSQASYYCLGDRLDVLGVAQIINKVIDKPITIHKIIGRGMNTFIDYEELNSMFDLDAEIKYWKVYDSGIMDYFFKHDGAEKRELIKQYNYHKFTWLNSIEIKFQLPKKFITTQWFGRSNRNNPDELYKAKILEHYKRLGCEIIPVASSNSIPQLQEKTENLRNIAHVMSRAEYHVGIDSGMMHLAKFSMPTERIHIYGGGPNPTSHYVESLMNWGAKFNYVGM